MSNYHSTTQEYMDTSRPSSEKQYHPPRHFTDERIECILRDIRAGAPKKYAAEANGIHESTLYNAIKQGLTDILHNEHDTRWANLVVSLRSIEMHEIMSCRQDIRDAPKGHKGAEWTLEHAYWREFCGDAKIIQLAEQVDELTSEKTSEKESKKS